MSKGRIPLFPLELVLYPGETIPLHIFEPRYKSLVQDCLKAERPFGIVLFSDGSLSDVGCVAEIREILKRYPDGRLDIAVEGQRRFRLAEIVEEQEYMQGMVDLLDDQVGALDRNAQQRVIAQHMRLLELAGRDVSPSVYQDLDYVSYFIARNAGLTLAQKQNVLELESESDRISFLVSFMETFIPQVERMDSLRKKIQSNGHIKDFPPSLPAKEED